MFQRDKRVTRRRMTEETSTEVERRQMREGRIYIYEREGLVRTRGEQAVAERSRPGERKNQTKENIVQKAGMCYGTQANRNAGTE